MEIHRECLVCGDPIQGRRDKRFCGDQCRAQYNNFSRRQSEMAILNINSILRKNRSILKSINPEGRTTISKEFVIKSGFDFRFFTSYYKTQRGVIYFFCYEYGYTEIETEKLIVINQQDYMDRFPNIVPRI